MCVLQIKKFAFVQKICEFVSIWNKTQCFLCKSNKNAVNNDGMEEKIG